MSGSKRRFDAVRQLPAGRWQVRYLGPDVPSRTAPNTFDTKRAADRWLVALEAEMLRGDWLDPDAGRIPLGDYADQWVRERDLRPRTRKEYARHLRLHVRPYLGTKPLSEIGPPHIRTWRMDRLADGVGRSTVAKTYRILHAMSATAVDDDLIRRNPCRIRSVARTRPRNARRSPSTRSSRSPGLINIETMELRVVTATGEMEDGTQFDDDPKSEAGKRTTSLPAALRTDIEVHLCGFAEPGLSGRLFVGPQGGLPRRRNFNRVWKKALRDAGIPASLDLHLHDLRHTGSTWSAQSGATLKEVMARIGHSSTRAAMIYQHATKERDQAIAAALDALIDANRVPDPDETPVA